MKRSLAFALVFFPLLAAPAPFRVGLGTSGSEYLLSAEEGCTVLTRQGAPLWQMKPGETYRFWWDAKGQAPVGESYRVQVGPPVARGMAEALTKRLAPFHVNVSLVPVTDGDTWRVLAGQFSKAADAQGLLGQLQAKGFDELWVATEKNPEKPLSPTGDQPAFYAVTERYDKLPLPKEGVMLQPKGQCITWVDHGRYRGDLWLFPNRQGHLTLVNAVPLETYLRGVVPKEMGAWQYPALEALKAQAVAARTYAVANRGKREGEGFDLLDTIADQVYGGRDAEHALTDKAIEETAGLVATYSGKPIQALFMANSGGATIDNGYVFGSGHAYLKGVSNYVTRPTCRTYEGRPAPEGDQRWLSMDLLRLVALGIVPYDTLQTATLEKHLTADALWVPLQKVAARLNLPTPKATSAKGTGLFLWMARALGLDQAAYGQERAQDTAYFLPDTALSPSDKPLATLLARRGLIPSPWWKAPSLSLLQGLQGLAKVWGELENLEFKEGVLLRDGQVRIKKGGPEPLPLAAQPLLVEEMPGGLLRLSSTLHVQVGDVLRWVDVPGGSPLLLRRLDPDGASMDRYNPTAHWKQDIKESDIAERLKQRVGAGGFKTLTTQQNNQGRVVELQVKDIHNKTHKFTGMRIRQLLGLKDNVFGLIEVGKSPNRRWVAYGRGWGHGVGMDQSGAYGFALEGWTFDQILKYYYQGIELKAAQ